MGLAQSLATMIADLKHDLALTAGMIQWLQP
jgi:hypothetical protein